MNMLWQSISHMDNRTPIEVITLWTDREGLASVVTLANYDHDTAATNHWEDIEDFHTLFPDVKIRHNVRWVDEGAIVTAAGISAGIDMSLHLISRIANAELAVCTAKQMEFEWTMNP